MNRIITSAKPWNADPTDDTDDANGVYRPFPMSSQPVAFAIPNSRDFSKYPVDLIRPLAKINIRLSPELAASGKFRINEVYIRHYHQEGNVIPSGNWTSNADVFDDDAVNTRGSATLSGNILYDGITNSEVVDRIYVYEQLGNDPGVVTTGDWGRDNFCLIINGNYRFPEDETTGDIQSVDGVCYRIDLLKSNPANPDANPGHVNILRNYCYDITINDVTAIGMGVL